jgi:hypothetical protein
MIKLIASKMSRHGTVARPIRLSVLADLGAITPPPSASALRSRHRRLVAISRNHSYALAHPNRGFALDAENECRYAETNNNATCGLNPA